MAHLLFRVDAVFSLKHGLVLTPGLGRGERCLIGDTVELRRPDGTILRTQIAGIEISSSPQATLPLLFKGICPEQVPIGTEVWALT